MKPVTGRGDVSPLDEEFVLCKVCLEHFEPEKRQPKELICNHVFCHTCIDKFLLNSKDKRNKKVRCPLCREITRCGTGGSKSLRTCEHSVNLVQLLKNIIPKRELKVKHQRPTSESQDPEDEDMDAFGVAKSKRVVVKSANPLLHPSKIWSDVNWSDDDDDDGSESKNVGKTRKSNKNKSDGIYSTSKNSAPYPLRSLQNMWNTQQMNYVKSGSINSETILEENDEKELHNITSNVDHLSDETNDLHLSTETESGHHSLRNPFMDQNSNFVTNPLFGADLSELDSIPLPKTLTTNSNDKPTLAQQEYSLNFTPAASENQFIDDCEDLDWNYFTQTSSLNSPKSTLKTSVSSYSQNLSESRSLNDIGVANHNQQLLTSPPSAVFVSNRTPRLNGQAPHNSTATHLNAFANGNLVSPSFIRASSDGHRIIVVDESNSGGNIHILSLTGTTIVSFKVSGEVNDVCLLNPSSSESAIKLGVGTPTGVEIYEAGSDGAIRTIPIGSISCIAPYKAGFIVGQDSSLNICSDLSCSVVLYSIRQTRMTRPVSENYNHSAAVGATFLTKVLDVATCAEKPDVIGVLLEERCIIIDQFGNILESITPNNIIPSESHIRVQISFSSAAEKILILNIASQEMEIHEILLFSGSKRFHEFTPADLGSTPGSIVLSGTLVGRDELFLIQQGVQMSQVRRYKIS